MKMFITLPNDRPVGLGVYAASWRALLGMDPKAMMRGFDHFPAPASEILAKLREGLDDRINRHDRSYGRGRKWDSDWERAMLHARNSLNTPRLIIDWLPPDLAGRFAHRLRANIEGGS